MTFRIGLVGAGRMGRVHLRALADSDAVRVVAIADPSAASRAALTDTDAAVYADVLAMVRAGGLDGVLIAAPSTLHLSLVRQIASAGLPILCEKPCGISAEEARQAATAAQRQGVKLQIAYWRRFVPSLRDLRRRIVAGDLGALYFLACHQWDAEPPAPQFRAGSGGIFIDMGVHEFDQIRWLTGQEIIAVHATVATVSDDPESAQALCRLSGGSTALVSLGQRFPLGDVCRVEVFGTRDAEDCRFLWPPEGEAVFLDALRRQAEAFAAWTRGGAADGASPADAVAALVAAERAEAEARR
jgi:myo-inositol 2-dehydrogenase/D-chiro-inositol 1-dehydrogenase